MRIIVVAAVTVAVVGFHYAFGYGESGDGAVLRQDASDADRDRIEPEGFLEAGLEVGEPAEQLPVERRVRRPSGHQSVDLGAQSLLFQAATTKQQSFFSLPLKFLLSAELAFVFSSHCLTLNHIKVINLMFSLCRILGIILLLSPCFH